MVFSSPIFLGLFLPLVLAVYSFANLRIRNFVLLTASILFYAWGEPYAVWIMIGLILVSYIFGLLIAETRSLAARKCLLTAGIVLNLAALLFYKYLGLLVGTFMPMLTFVDVTIHIPEIALPIGISFYVFQIVSYLIDVFRGDVAVQKNPLCFMMYVSFFPQLIAGPIVRYRVVEDAMYDRSLCVENIHAGLRRFVVGLAKKVIIADSMAIIADKVFDANVATVPGIYCWIGIIAYTLQIYYDFSGYSDMAIGLGRIFNFRFAENFNFPYSALSIQDFWRRWHLSLSTWFRDYLYIPLGGNRKGAIRTYCNMFVVFFLCGLWHGAAWNFAIWGVYHGLGLIVERCGFGYLIKRIPPFVANLYVLLFVMIGWVFFRANTLTEACSFLGHMFIGNDAVSNRSFLPALDFISLANLWILIGGCVLAYPRFWVRMAKLPDVDKDLLLILGVVVTFCVALTSGYSPFIYFRF